MKPTETAAAVNGSAEEVRDGHYFLRVHNAERDRLVATADKLDADIETLLAADESEETLGVLRSASGKARLLASKKMRQFEQLCEKNITPAPDDPCPTKNEDLQGFWDMVMLQVQHVDSLFAEVEAMRANGWRRPEASPVPVVAAAATPASRTAVVRAAKAPAAAPTPASIAAAAKREEQRKQLAELKRKYKEQAKATAAQNDGPAINVVQQ